MRVNVWILVLTPLSPDFYETKHYRLVLQFAHASKTMGSEKMLPVSITDKLQVHVDLYQHFLEFLSLRFLGSLKR